MVKGISRQVIVVHSPDPKLFEQAIFILKDNAVGEGITDEALLKEAQKSHPHRRPDEKEAAPVPLRRGVGGGRRTADRAYLAHYGIVLGCETTRSVIQSPILLRAAGRRPEGNFPCG